MEEGLRAQGLVEACPRAKEVRLVSARLSYRRLHYVRQGMVWSDGFPQVPVVDYGAGI